MKKLLTPLIAIVMLLLSTQTFAQMQTAPYILLSGGFTWTPYTDSMNVVFHYDSNCTPWVSTELILTKIVGTDSTVVLDTFFVDNTLIGNHTLPATPNSLYRLDVTLNNTNGSSQLHTSLYTLGPNGIAELNPKEVQILSRQGAIQIRTSSGFENADLSLVTLDGKRVDSAQVISGEARFNITSGVYVLIATRKDGLVASRKVIAY